MNKLFRQTQLIFLIIAFLTGCNAYIHSLHATDLADQEKPDVEAELQEAAEAFLSDEEKKELQDFNPKSPPDRSLSVVEENFEKRFLPVFNAVNMPLGALPQEWQDASGPGSSVLYGALHEDTFEGNMSLRIDVKTVGRGAVELRYTPVPLKRGLVLRINLSMRSEFKSPLRFGLKSSSDQEAVYLEQPVHAPGEWASGQIIFQVSKSDPNAVFYVAFDKPGQVDIDAFSISLFRPREGAPVPALGESANLLSTSTFPAGVHTPWVFLDGDYAQTDYSEFGPTGIPALTLSGYGASLQVPFKGVGYGEYTFSLYIKGKKPGQAVSLLLMPPTGSTMVFPYNQRVFVDSDWRRYSSTVPLKIDPDGFYLARLISQSKEPLWIDGLQVEYADEPGPYQRTAPVELVAQPLNPYGIFLDGEPLIVQVTVCGVLSPTRKILGKLYDHTGRSYALKPLLVEGSNIIQRTLVVKDLGEPKLGPFWLELQAYNMQDDPVSPLFEMLMVRVRVPREVNEFCPDSPFGVILGQDTDTAERIGVARALGFKWVADDYHFSWNNLESSEGKWDFEMADQWLEIYERYGMGLLATLGPSPRWAVEQPEEFPLDLPLVPRNPVYWENAVTTMGEHFSGRIQAWQPWPKPFNERTLSAIRLKFELRDDDHFTGSEGTDEKKSKGKKQLQKVITPVISPPQEFVALQKTAFDILSEIDPEAFIIAPLEVSSNRLFSEQVLSRGIDSGANVFGFEDGYLDQIPSARVAGNIAWMREISANDYPVWQIRANTRRRIVKNAYKHYPPEVFAEDDEYITEEIGDIILYTLEALSSGVERLFYPAFAVNAFPNIYQYTYRLFNIDGRLNPEAAALSNLMWQLEGKSIPRKEKIGDAIMAYFASDEKEAMVVLISDPGVNLQVETELLESLELMDIYGNTQESFIVSSDKPTYLLASGFSSRQLLFYLKTLKFESQIEDSKETEQ